MKTYICYEWISWSVSSQFHVLHRFSCKLKVHILKFWTIHVLQRNFRARVQAFIFLGKWPATPFVRYKTKKKLSVLTSKLICKFLNGWDPPSLLNLKNDQFVRVDAVFFSLKWFSSKRVCTNQGAGNENVFRNDGKMKSVPDLFPKCPRSIRKGLMFIYRKFR